MADNQTPTMTADKAHWTAIATAVTSVFLAMTGATAVDVDGLAGDATQALSLVAAIAIQAAVAWLTAYYKRNHLK